MSSETILRRIWNINFDEMYMTPTLTFKKMVQISASNQPLYAMTEYCIYLRYMDGNIHGWQQKNRSGPFSWRVLFDINTDMQRTINTMYQDHIAEKYILGVK